MEETPEEFMARVKTYHRLYNRANQRAFTELKNRHPEEYQELLEKHRKIVAAEAQAEEAKHQQKR